MARWEPGTPERLQRAAFELFARHGYEQTTAREIAQAVGLTERTFFRHFSDKREVLFHGQDAFVGAFVDGIEGAPADASAIDAVAAALRSAAGWFPNDGRAHSRARQRVIDANPALRERETQKLSVLATTIAAALRARGVEEPGATLAAQSGVTVFGIAFLQWLADGEERTLQEISDAVLDELVGLARTATAAARQPVAR